MVSMLQARARYNCDLDVAVLGKELIYFKTLLKIYSAFSEIFGDNSERELDFKSLYKIDPLFCYQVAKYSKLLYGNLLDYNKFRAYAFRAYYDAKDLFKL